MADEKKQERGWFAQRIPVFIQMAIGFAILSVAYQHVSTTNYKFPTVNSLERRIAYTLRCLAISIVPLVVSLIAVSLARFSSAAINPLSGNEKLLEIPARTLQNTLEQFLMHSFIVLALSTLVDDANFKFIPFMIMVFVVARVVFIIGYRIHQSTRVLGFMTTFIPTVMALIQVLQLIYNRGLTSF